jgi:hypothetical protein
MCSGGEDVAGTSSDEKGGNETGGDETQHGLQLFTMGHLLSRIALDDSNGNWNFDSGSLDTTLRALSVYASFSPGTLLGSSRSKEYLYQR